MIHRWRVPGLDADGSVKASHCGQDVVVRQGQAEPGEDVFAKTGDVSGEHEQPPGDVEPWQVEVREGCGISAPISPTESSLIIFLGSILTSRDPVHRH